MTRFPSMLSLAFRPLRSLFVETTQGDYIIWRCNLCTFQRAVAPQADGRPMSAKALQALVDHLEFHSRS
jgi:hypothetical protein